MFNLYQRFWIFRCDITKLPPQSPLLLDAMIKVSKNLEYEPRTRGLGFTAMGKLALKLPNLFSVNLNLVKDAFQALSKVYRLGILT